MRKSKEDGCELREQKRTLKSLNHVLWNKVVRLKQQMGEEMDRAADEIASVQSQIRRVHDETDAMAQFLQSDAFDHDVNTCDQQRRLHIKVKPQNKF